MQMCHCEECRRFLRFLSEPVLYLIGKCILVIARKGEIPSLCSEQAWQSHG